MLDSYFVAPKTLRRLRSGTFGPYLDRFAEELKRRGYSHWTAVKYLRSAAHLGRFVELRAIALEAVSEGTLDTYRQHLLRCRCPRPFSEKVNPHAFCGARLLVDHLREAGVVADLIAKQAEANPPLIDSFGQWLQQHRGVSAHTRRQHCRRAADFLRCLGDDPSRYDAQGIREFFVMRHRTSSQRSAQALAASLRAFLRFLIVQGLCRTGLDQAVPALARWRLASLPQGLSASEVAQLLAACNGGSVARIRDRAIILLLVRLGLRAGDVAELSLTDIDWKDSSLVVSGKSRREVRLPLPQEVGDALLTYLECRPAANTDRVFLRVIAPIRPFRRGDAVSSVVKSAMRRADVTAPVTGAHVLRHTAAREMLRQGVSLYEIGSLLRHRSIETTAYYYAKVDRDLLESVAQPWPEMLR
ncbi:MAG: tyrosine-type recombinase/integrase [bacterium]|nr:tyrosine-type recombinase/integrase [bacterium]